MRTIEWTMAGILAFAALTFLLLIGVIHRISDSLLLLLQLFFLQK